MNPSSPTDCWSTPADSPLCPSFPYTYRSVEVLTLVYRTDPEAIRRVLPAPLVPVGDRVLIHIYNMPDTEWLGPYNECNVMVGAELPGKAVGGFSPYFLINSDGGLALGREIHGQPKKFGQPLIEYRGDLIVGTAERNGILCCTGTMAYKQQRGSLEDLKKQTFDFALNINHKVIQHIDGRPAVRQITGRRLTDVKIHECWRGPCTVELRPNAQFPLHRLPVLEECDGYYWKADFTLIAGEVLHDYLA
jgi:acetoacetate decarboxylase